MATQQSRAKRTEGLNADADPVAQRLPLISVHRKRKAHMAPFFFFGVGVGGVYVCLRVCEDFVSRISLFPFLGNQVNLIFPLCNK